MILHEIEDIARDHDQLREFRHMVNGAAIVRIQEVADYYWANKQVFWMLMHDFPNVAPPWPKFWVEWVTPQTGYLDIGWMNPVPNAGLRCGCLITSFKPEDVLHLTSLSPKWNDLFNQPHADKILTQSRWGLSFSFFSTRGLWCLGHQFLFVNKEGGIIGLDKDHCIRPQVSNLALLEGFSEDDFDAIATGYFLNIVLLAMCFCHCKNIDVKTEEIPPPLQKKHRERNRTPISKYHVLNITPLKKIFHQNAPGESLQRAMHLCRAHFKDFREGSGLFGKLHGNYFWPMHLRGNPDKGTVDKQYNVKKPEGEKEGR